MIIWMGERSLNGERMSDQQGAVDTNECRDEAAGGAAGGGFPQPEEQNVSAGC